MPSNVLVFAATRPASTSITVLRCTPDGPASRSIDRPARAAAARSRRRARVGSGTPAGTASRWEPPGLHSHLNAPLDVASTRWAGPIAYASSRPAASWCVDRSASTSDQREELAPAPGRPRLWWASTIALMAAATNADADEQGHLSDQSSSSGSPRRSPAASTTGRGSPLGDEVSGTQGDVIAIKGDQISYIRALGRMRYAKTALSYVMNGKAAMGSESSGSKGTPYGVPSTGQIKDESTPIACNDSDVTGKPDGIKESGTVVMHPNRVIVEVIFEPESPVSDFVRPDTASGKKAVEALCKK